MKVSITSALTVVLFTGLLHAADPAKPTTPADPKKPATGTEPAKPAVPPVGTRSIAPATGTPGAGAPGAGVPGANPEAQRDQQSYRFGFNIGNTLKRQASKIVAGDFGAGLSDGLKSDKPSEDVKGLVATFEKLITELAAEEKAASQKNMELSQAYLKDHAKKDGVVTLPSGLQYRVLKEGTGESPKATDEVSVNYRGTLIDGTEFDSSYKRGEPATFPVNRVIKGWTEALQKMKPGAKWELVIPSDLAYGEAGTGAQIGPNSTLIFEVELLTVKAPSPAVQPGPQIQIPPK